MISRREHDLRVAEFDAKREQFKRDWIAFARFLSVSPFGERQLNQELATQGLRRADLNRLTTIEIKAEPMKEA